jgi:hypothetical protein
LNPIIAIIIELNNIIIIPIPIVGGSIFPNSDCFTRNINTLITVINKIIIPGILGIIAIVLFPFLIIANNNHTITTII